MKENIYVEMAFLERCLHAARSGTATPTEGQGMPEEEIEARLNALSSSLEEAQQ